MFCRKCGVELEERNVYCHKCGEPTAAAATVTAPALPAGEYPGFPQSALLVGIGLALQIGTGIIIAIASIIVYYVKYSKIKISFIESTPFIIVSSLAGVGCTALVVLIAMRIGKKNIKSVFSGAIFKPGWIYYLLIASAVLGLGVVLSEFDNLLRLVFPSQSIGILMAKVLAKNAIGIILLVIIAPVIEEILFRGIILKGLLSRYSAKKAIVISAALFTVIHMSLVQMLPIFVIGLLLGLLYHKTRSLLPCIFAHAANNLISTLAYNYFPQEGPFQPLWVDVCGIVLFVAGFAALVAVFRKREKEKEPLKQGMKTVN